MTTTQSGVIATTLPLLQSDIHAAATVATNTQSTLLSDLIVVPSVQTSRGQGHYGMPTQTDTCFCNLHLVAVLLEAKVSYHQHDLCKGMFKYLKTRCV